MIVLGIDPGETVSGWAIALDNERIHVSGTAKNAEQRAAALVQAQSLSSELRRPLRVCIEWVSSGGGGTRTAMGIGQARGRWLEQVELSLGITKRRVITVQPQQWRAATHGVTRHPKGVIQAEKTRRFKRAACAYAGVEQPDEAEACCIVLAAFSLAEVA